MLRLKNSTQAVPQQEAAAPVMASRWCDNLDQLAATRLTTCRVCEILERKEETSPRRFLCEPAGIVDIAAKNMNGSETPVSAIYTQSSFAARLGDLHM
jgi:hypothetical protein